MVSKILSLTPFVAAAMACSGGFASTCSNIRLSGTTLIAYCGDGHGGYDTTSYSLNSCIGNVRGNLVCNSGNFGATCNDLTLSGTTLFATCGNGAGGYNSVSFDLNRAIGNFGGTIHC